MEIDGKVVNNSFMDRNIKCPDCGTKCLLMAFNKIPDDAVEAAKKKGLYIDDMPSGEPIIAVCAICTDLIKKVEKNTDNTEPNDPDAA